MSRAFITDKEDWAYCPKAGERCMYAEEGKDCRRTSCEHYERQADLPGSDADSSGSSGGPASSGRAGLRTVRRESAAANASDYSRASKAGAAGSGKTGTAGSAKTKRAAEPKTKRAKLSMPRRWGGRSGNNF